MPTSEKIRLKNVRGSYLKVMKPEPFAKPTDPLRYSATYLLDPSNRVHAKAIKQIVAFASTIATEEWPKGIPDSTLFGFGYSDGSDLIVADEDFPSKRKKNEGYKDMFYISCGSPEDSPPMIVSRSRTVMVFDKEKGYVQVPGETDQIFKKDEPYSGCYVNATVTLWTQDNQWGKRINANMLAIQFSEAGEAFSNRVDTVAEEEFDEIPDDEDLNEDWDS